MNKKYKDDEDVPSTIRTNSSEEILNQLKVKLGGNIYACRMTTAENGCIRNLHYPNDFTVWLEQILSYPNHELFN